MKPADLRRLLQEGQTLQRAGKLSEAAGVYARVRQADPRNLEAWHLGGNAALLQGRPAEALELYAAASRLQPKSAVLSTCLGVANLALGRPAEAEKHLRAALKLEPKNAEVWSQLATLLSTVGRDEEAVTCHRQAVAYGPKSAQVWHGYAATLANLNRTGEALDCERRALAIDPTYAPARRGHAAILQKSHRLAEAVKEYDAVLAQNPRQLDVQSHRLFALNYLEAPKPTDLFAAHEAYGRLVETGVTEPALSNSRVPDRRLRVAFFSADLREHSVAYFLEPLLQHLPRDQFELCLYNTGAKSDHVTARFRALAHRWHDLPSQLENVVEPVVRTDAPDIAIDLGGHTGLSLLPLFARRLAPVQIAYLGYPNTTGLRAMDYRFVDAITDPPGEADRLHTEKLIRFSPCAWTYAPPAEAPAPRSASALTRGQVTFGSFNNFSKVTDSMLQLWAKLLAAVPDSRLLLKSTGLGDPAIAKPLHERLTRAGLPADRINFAGFTTTTAEHLAAYSQVDIALDTSPYNGTTTTCEALWMGVPVISLQGDRHAARVSSSLLQAAGQPGLIATSREQYLSLARQLAGDPARLTMLRTRLREDLRRSILLDHAGQSARFAQALRACWQNWCTAGDR